MKRLGILISLVALIGLTLASPVLAAGPANDVYAGRVVIDSLNLPFSDSLDTTEATTDADDVEANAECGAPATDASVWYEFTPVADGDFLVDVSLSDYPVGVIVLSGSPGSFASETCGASVASFFGLTDVAYTILAFDYESGTGGNLEISVGEAPPPVPAPEIDLTVDSRGSFNKTGSATIRGTTTCTGEVEFGFFEIEVTQSVGRFKITGFGFGGDKGGDEFVLVCDGTPQPWSIEVLGSNGKFKGGKAVVSASVVACGSSECGEDSATRTIRLKK